ncbi:unnamed protein product [Calypogeia fissa]
MVIKEEEGKALLEDLGPKSSPSDGDRREQNNAPLSTEIDTTPTVHEGRATLSLGLVICVAVIIVVAVYIIGGGLEGASDVLASTVQTQNWGTARVRQKLEKPVLIVISSDGFRWGYNYKVPTPNIERLRVNGTEAESGLIPVYPSLTFPNHYSIATGLYPAWHGIIENHFSDPYDPGAEPFYQGNLNPKWWLGEPIWVTVTKSGLQAATYFWPGSEVKKDPWTCPPKFCMAYNSSVRYEQRVDKVLTYFDLPAEEMPSYMSLYFESPDEEGHLVGPDAPEISLAVSRIDSLIGTLITGLEERGVFEDVTIILLGDHGMVANCDAKVIYVEDFKPWIEIDSQWIDNTGAIFAVRPPPDVDVGNIYTKLKEALSSGKVQNSQFLDLYLKEDLPERFLYSSSDRVQPIIGIPAEGFKVVYERLNTSQCGGAHGYDNSLLSMRTIFIAHGPEFARGRKVPSFINVELYNVFTTILGLQDPAANNGSSLFASSLLLPSP